MSSELAEEVEDVAEAVELVEDAPSAGLAAPEASNFTASKACSASRPAAFAASAALFRLDAWVRSSAVKLAAKPE